MNREELIEILHGMEYDDFINARYGDTADKILAIDKQPTKEQVIDQLRSDSFTGGQNIKVIYLCDAEEALEKLYGESNA